MAEDLFTSGILEEDYRNKLEDMDWKFRVGYLLVMAYFGKHMLMPIQHKRIGIESR